MFENELDEVASMLYSRPWIPAAAAAEVRWVDGPRGGCRRRGRRRV
jgi:hypothetical protein